MMFLSELFIPALIVGTVISLIAGIIILCKNKSSLPGKILLFIGLEGVLGAGVFFSALFLFSDLTALKYGEIYPVFLFIGLTAILALCFFAGIKKTVKAAIAVSAALVLFGCGAGILLYQIHYDNIAVVGVNDNLLEEYMPFRVYSKTAKLDETSSLRLNDNLPVMDGATALFPVYAAFAEAVYSEESLNNLNYYELDDYSIKSPLKCSTTSGAYENIVTGNADIIFVAQASEKQKEAAKDAGVELVFTPIGKEAFVFFVNANNPVSDLTVENIKDVYSGKITKWSDLGAKGLGSITAFQRDEGSGSQSAMLRFMGDTPLMEAPIERIVMDMGGIVERTSDYRNFKNAIGYSFRFYCNEMVKSDGIKLLNLNGVSPTRENIVNGTYPQASYFYAVTRSDAPENVKQLLDFITGPQGQYLVEKTGYVPLN